MTLRTRNFTPCVYVAPCEASQTYEGFDCGAHGRRDARPIVSEVQDAGSALKRALVARRMFADVHDTVLATTTAAHEKLCSVLAQLDEPLRFDVTPTCIRVGEQMVLEDANESTEAFASTLYADGVQSLRFTSGLERSEVAQVLARWSAAMRGQFATDHSFSTALWEDELPHIRVVSLQELAESQGGDGDRVEGLVDDIVAVRTTRRLDDAVAKLTIADVELAPVVSLSPRELAQLAGSIGSARKAAAQRLIVQMLPALSWTDAHTSLLASVLPPLVLNALQTGGLDNTRRMLTRIVDFAGTDPAYLPALEATMGMLADDRVLDAIVAALDRVDQRAAAIALLRYVPRRHIAAVLARVGRPTTPDGATALIELVAKKTPTLEVLRASVDETHGTAVFRVARMLSVPACAAVLQQALALGPATARPVFAAIKSAEVPALRSELLEAMTSGDSELESTALTLLTRVADPMVIDPLVRRAQQGGDPARTAIAALVAVGNREALMALRAVFASVQDRDVRAAAALALGQLADVESVPLLQVEAGRFFAAPGLKAACKEALRRIALSRSAP